MSTTGSMLKVLGVGSAAGDDSLGWDLVRELAQDNRLRAACNGGLQFCEVDHPAELPWLLRNCRVAIVIDAIRSGSAPGTLHVMSLDSLPGPGALSSSHGIDVVNALALATSLNPTLDVTVYGIEAMHDASNATLSAPVLTAKLDLRQRLQRDIVTICNKAPG